MSLLNLGKTNNLFDYIFMDLWHGFLLVMCFCPFIYLALERTPALVALSERRYGKAGGKKRETTRPKNCANAFHSRHFWLVMTTLSVPRFSPCQGKALVLLTPAKEKSALRSRLVFLWRRPKAEGKTEWGKRRSEGSGEIWSTVCGGRCASSGMGLWTKQNMGSRRFKELDLWLKLLPCFCHQFTRRCLSLTSCKDKRAGEQVQMGVEHICLRAMRAWCHLACYCGKCSITS